MRTVYLLLLSLLIASPLFSQDPREMRLVGEPVKLDSEMVARRDINGNYCAAIQVISDMDGFAYDAFDGVVGDVDSRPGLDIVFLTTGERVLEIYQRGYQPLKLILSEHGIRLRPREVWQITVAGDAPPAQTLPVTIRITPADARLTINGNRVSNAGTHPLVPGNHSVKVEKEGFKTEQKTIAVSEQQVFFEFALQRQPDAGLQIETTPVGATVYLDGVNLGQSPVAVFYKPGVYPIRIVKDGYVSLENQSLEVKLPQTRKSYTLEEDVGYITINTHSGAKVFFNDQRIINPKNLKLPPQLLRVKVTMPKAEPLEQQVVLRRNDRLTLDMFPVVQTATLQVAVTPFDAIIELTGDAGEKFTARGMKIFENIPIGTYTIKVSAAGYEPKQETATLKTGERLNRSIRLTETRAAQAAATDYGIEMVFVKGGSFTMGCTDEQGTDCFPDENPPHPVTVRDFYIGKYEVTQKQWRAVMGSDPPELRFKGCDDCPVERVSWNDVQEFIKKLNQLTGRRYRLPTEAEWEFAARGGTQSKGYKYAGSNNIDEVAWYWNNSTSSGHTIRDDGRGTFPVGRKKANELGLYDMSGNVWEWCEDDWHDNYNGAPTNGRAWTDSPRGDRRVLRGGSWRYSSRNCRVSNRVWDSPDYRDDNNGFRLAQDF